MKKKKFRNDKAIKGGFDSHFVGITRKDKHAPKDVMQSDFYELVLEKNEQVLPIAIVHFK